MPLVRGLLHSNDGRQSWLHEQTTLDSRQTVCKPLDISLLLMRGVLDVDDALQKSTIEIQNNYQYAVCLGAGHHWGASCTHKLPLPSTLLTLKQVAAALLRTCKSCVCLAREGKRCWGFGSTGSGSGQACRSCCCSCSSDSSCKASCTARFKSCGRGEGRRRRKGSFSGASMPLLLRRIRFF